MASVYKRGEVWWGRVTRKGREFRKSLETASESVAKKRLAKWIEALQDADWGESEPLSFDDAMLHFSEHHIPNLKPASGRRYRTSMRQLFPTFTGKSLLEITHGALAEFEQGRRRDGASAPTIRRDLACLSSMFESIILDKDLTIANPVPGFLKKRKRRGALKEAPPRDRYLSHDEEARLLAACVGRLKYLRPMIAFAIDTGLRLEEQLSLEHKHVNLRRSEVTIRETKTGVPRVVPLLPRSAQIAAQQPVWHKEPHYLFHKKSTGERYDKLTRGLASACRAANIEGLRWHDLRRTCGCRLIQDHRLHIEEVSKWLGHASIQQTQRAYAFLFVDQLHARVGTRLGTAHADSENGGAK